MQLGVSAAAVPLLEWLGVIENGQLNVAWLRAPAANLKAAITARLDKLIDAVESLLGARDSTGLGLPSIPGESWHPLLPIGQDEALAIYVVLTPDGTTTRISLGLRNQLPAGDGLTVSLVGRIPLLAIDPTPTVVALLGDAQRGGTFDLSLEVDGLGLSTGTDATRVALAGARLGLCVPFDPNATVKASLDLLDVQIGSAAPSDLSIADLSQVDPEILRSVVRAVAGTTVSGQLLVTALGLDGDALTSLSWSTLANATPQTLITWLGRIAASDDARTWSSAIAALLGVPDSDLGFTAGGWAPRFSTRLTTTQANATVTIIGEVAPFAISFQGGQATCPMDASITLRLEGVSGPLVSTTVQGVAARIGAAEFGISLAPTSSPVVAPRVVLEDVGCGAQTWPTLGLAQLETPIQIAGAAATAALQSELGAATALIAFLGLDSQPTIDLAMLASDPLRALDCFWRAQANPASLLDRIASLLGVPTTTPAPDATWAALVIDEAPVRLALDIGTVESLVPDGTRTLFASVDASTTFVGKGVQVDLRVEPRIVEIANGALCSGEAEPPPAWLPQVELWVALSSATPNSKLVLDAGAIVVAVDRITVDVPWRVGLPPVPWITIDGLTVTLAGTTAPITLPTFTWSSTGWTPKLDLTAPDFSLGPLGVEALSWLLGLSLRRTGSLGFAFALVFGWQPKLPSLAGSSWTWPKLSAQWTPNVDWGSWPTFAPSVWNGTWPSLALDPLAALRAWWTKLFADPSRVHASLWLLGLGWAGKLPDPRLALDGVVSGALPPIALTGSGTYDDPWALTVLEPGIRQLELIAWIEGDLTAVPPVVGGVGWGLRLKPQQAPVDALVVETNLRLDLGYIAVQRPTAAEPIPAFHVTSTVRNATQGAPIVTVGPTNLTNFRVGARFSEGIVVSPVIALDGDVRFDVTGGAALPPGMRDALASVFATYGVTGGSAAFSTLAEWLVETGLAIQTADGYGLHPNGLDTLARDPTLFVLTLARDAWTDPARRSALGAAAGALFGSDLISPLFADAPGPTGALVRAILDALGWTTGSTPWAPDLSVLLQAIGTPGKAFTTAAKALAAADACAKLRATIAKALGGAPSLAIAPGLAVSLDAAGVVALVATFTPSADALTPLAIELRLELDLASSTVAAAVGARGSDLGASIAIGSTPAVTVTIGSVAYPVDQPHFPDLVEGVVRIVIAGLAGVALEAAAGSHPELGPLFAAVGLLDRAGLSSPLVADDLVDLLRDQADVSAWTARLGLGQPHGIAALVSHVGGALSQLFPDAVSTAADGSVALALNIDGLSASVSLPATLVPEISLAISQPIAKMALRRAALAAADTASLVLTRSAGATTMTLTIAGQAIQLIPFGGQTGLLGAANAATMLLPWAMQLLVDKVPASVVDLKALATGLKVTVDEAKAWRDTPAQALTDLFTQSNAVFGALAKIPGLQTVANGVQVVGLPVTLTSSNNNPSLHIDLALGYAKVTADVTFSGVEAAPSFALAATFSPQIAVGPGITLQAGVNIATTTPLAVTLYPIGVPTGTTAVLRVDLLPVVKLTGERANGAASLQDAIVSFGTQVLLPAVVGWVVSANAVKTFLTGDPNHPDDPGRLLADALIAAEILEAGSLSIKTSQTKPLPRLVNGLSSLLAEASQNWWPSWSTFGVKLTVDGTRVGFKLSLPDLEISTAPDLSLTTTVPSPWSGSGDVGGITVYLLNDGELAPQVIATLGLSLAGTDAQPLIGPLGGVSLREVDAWVRAQVAFDPVAVDLSYRVEVDGLSLPLGAIAGTSSVLQALLGSTDDTTAATPTSAPSISAAIEISKDGVDFILPDRITLPVQAGFGPVHISEIVIDKSANGISIGLDAGIMVGQLDVELDDFGVTIPAATPFDLGTWAPQLSGLGISYTGDDVNISGKLLKNGNDYQGLCAIEVAGYGLGAVGGFSTDPTSFYIFAALDAPIGGPPCFFITGVAAGFGYNRTIIAPKIDEIDTFPLIEAFGQLPTSPTAGQADATQGAKWTSGQDWFPVAVGSGWFALGLKFTTFVVIEGRAVAYVELGDGVEIGIVGRASLALPTDDTTIVSLELLLLARLSTREGVFSIAAQLSDNSWLFTKDCRLTGGFAFCVWFGGPHRGDFVITLGGYHPRFAPPNGVPPDWYPTVPRLGFAWCPTNSVVISGQAYFGLTPSCVMAGGRLDARYNGGGIQAWFTAYADILVQWKPFFYDFDIGLSIGVKCWVADVELSASVHLWGPQLSAEVHVSIFVVSFTVSFGASATKTQPPPLSLADFIAELPSADASGGSDAPKKLACANISSGLLPRRSPTDTAIIVAPIFALQVESAFPLVSIEVNDQDVSLPQAVQIDFAPMDRNAENPKLTVTVSGDEVVPDPTCAPILAGAPVALWEARPANEDNSSPRVQTDAYNSVQRGVTLRFTSMVVGSFGSFTPTPTASEVTEVDRWNPLLAASSAALSAKPAMMKALQVRRTVEQPKPRMRAAHAIPLSGEPIPPDASTHRTRRSLDTTGVPVRVRAHEMALLPVASGRPRTLQLDQKARVVQLDRRGGVLRDELGKRLKLDDKCELCLIAAPTARSRERKHAVAGWTVDEWLAGVSPRHVVGADCVVRTDRPLTALAPRKLGSDRERAAWPGSALARGGTVTRVGSTKVECIAVLFSMPKQLNELDRILAVARDDSGKELRPHRMVLHDSLITLLFEPMPVGVGIRVASDRYVRGVIGFANDVDDVFQAVSKSAAPPRMARLSAARSDIHYRVVED